MSGSRDNNASSAAENPTGPSKVFDLALARRMLPLVQQIAEGIMAGRDLTFARRVQQEPLSQPLHKSVALNPEAGELMKPESAASE